MPLSLSEEDNRLQGLQPTPLTPEMLDGGELNKKKKKKIKNGNEADEIKKKKKKRELNGDTDSQIIGRPSRNRETRKPSPLKTCEPHTLQLNLNSTINQNTATLVSPKTYQESLSINNKPTDRTIEYEPKLSDLSDFHNATVANSLRALEGKLHSLEQECIAKISKVVEEHKEQMKPFMNISSELFQESRKKYISPVVG
jgi:hypothetical protein